jgi:hypothetical protein
VGSGREAHGKENPRKLYVVGLRTQPTPLVRGSSRRITIMRFRPANIRVINRRNSRFDRDLRCLLRKDKEKTVDWVIPYQCFTGRALCLRGEGGRELCPRVR